MGQGPNVHEFCSMSKAMVNMQRYKCINYYEAQHTDNLYTDWPTYINT